MVSCRKVSDLLSRPEALAAYKGWIILASDWWILITWPQYWSLICQFAAYKGWIIMTRESWGNMALKGQTTSLHHYHNKTTRSFGLWTRNHFFLGFLHKFIMEFSQQVAILIKFDFNVIFYLTRDFWRVQGNFLSHTSQINIEFKSKHLKPHINVITKMYVYKVYLYVY